MNEQNILELIEQKKYIELKSILEEMNEVDIAEILDEVDAHTALIIFRMLPKDLAVEVFAYFDVEQQSYMIETMTDKELKYIVEELFFDDMVDLIEEVPANIVSKLLAQSSKEQRALINEFLKYPPDSAGSLMTIEYVELRKNMTVAQAMEHIKDIGLSKETVYTCYVTDKNRKLEGIVSLRKLVVSPDNAIVEDLMDEDVIFVNTHDDQEEVADVFKKYGFIALPVVDKEHRLTGIITVDDIIEVMEQEATEDFQRMAAMAPSEDAYLSTSVFNLAKHRILWLMILMISATFTGRIIKNASDVLATVIVLNMFIPMLMDTGGNSGNQSSTLIIRGLATGEISLSDAPKVLWKEFRIALMVGLSLSTLNFFRLLLLEKVELKVAILVSTTLTMTVIIAKLLGGSLPMIAKRLKIDPAIMAGPLITTIVDALSLTIYFTLATIIFGL